MQLFNKVNYILCDTWDILLFKQSFYLSFSSEYIEQYVHFSSLINKDHTANFCTALKIYFSFFNYIFLKDSI